MTPQTSDMMIISGKDPVLLRPGLGLVPGLVADSHWLERNRIERLRDVIEDNPGHFGLGIDSQTAVILHQGQLRVIGIHATPALADSAFIADTRTRRFGRRFTLLFLPRES